METTEEVLKNTYGHTSEGGEDPREEAISTSASPRAVQHRPSGDLLIPIPLEGKQATHNLGVILDLLPSFLNYPGK